VPGSWKVRADGLLTPGLPQTSNRPTRSTHSSWHGWLALGGPLPRHQFAHVTLCLPWRFGRTHCAALPAIQIATGVGFKTCPNIANKSITPFVAQVGPIDIISHLRAMNRRIPAGDPASDWGWNR